MSHTMANSAPPPRQCPCTAAIVTSSSQPALESPRETSSTSRRPCRECARPRPRPPKTLCPRRSERSRKRLAAIRSPPAECAQFLHHGDVDDVQRRIAQHNPRNRAVKSQLRVGRVWDASMSLSWLSYKLIADFRTSPMVESGSRAPVFSAIHFFSLLMMSSKSFLSSADGM